MAITVAHSPSAATIAGSAYRGGLGEFEKFRLQRQLQLEEMAQRERLALTDMANRRVAQMASQQHQAQQAGFDRAARMQMQGLEMMGRQAEMKARRDEAREAREFEGDLRWDLGVMGEEGADKRAGMVADRADKAAAEAAERAAEDDRRAFVMDRYAKGDWTLSGGARARLEKIRSDRMALKTNPMIPEHVKQRQLEALDDQYWSILESPEPPMPGEKPKSKAEEFAEETFEKRFPDGTTKIYSKDRSGAWRIVDEHDPSGGKGDERTQSLEIRKEMAKEYAKQKKSRETDDGPVEEPFYTPEELDHYITTGKMPPKAAPKAPSAKQQATQRGHDLYNQYAAEAGLPQLHQPQEEQPAQQPVPPSMISGMGPIGEGSLGNVGQQSQGGAAQLWDEFVDARGGYSKPSSATSQKLWRSLGAMEKQMANTDPDLLERASDLDGQREALVEKKQWTPEAAEHYISEVRKVYSEYDQRQKIRLNAGGGQRPVAPGQDDWAKKLPKSPEEARKNGVPYFLAPDGTVRKLQ